MAEAHWYVVHTYSGYENKVKIDIENTIKNRNLQDQILEVSVPMQSVVEIKNGVEKAADKKMFPGYVLIHMVMNDDTWYVVRNTRGVTGFVGPGSKPVPLTDEEMAGLGFSRSDVVVGYEVGDTVVDILEGKNAGVWTIGLLMGSNLLGLTEEEAKEIDPKDLEARKQVARQKYLDAGADLVLDWFTELPAAISALESAIKEGRRP